MTEISSILCGLKQWVIRYITNLEPIIENDEILLLNKQYADM